MAFYLSPPGGNISLQKLTQFAVTRFNFLSQIYESGGDRIQIYDIINNPDTVQNCECLIEGSVKDKISHFILRLICSCDEDMKSFFVESEKLLFDFRFANMSEDELCRLLKSVDRFVQTANIYNLHKPTLYTYYKTKLISTLSQIKGRHSSWRSVVRLYLSGVEQCFTVPFQTVLQLVARRQVVIKSGQALVPVCKLRDVITSLYCDYLIGAMRHVSNMFHTEDERMRNLIRTLKVLYRQRYPGLTTTRDIYTMSHTEIDDVVHMFPPCMSQLHKSLTLTHRLRHHSRIQYSLFLKEAGLPVHEALMFWRKEYSQLPSKNTGCSHDWYKHEKRYTYNIRHLYGLEGSRINYRGHTCQALQMCNNGPQDSGGCPFKQYDTVHLQTMLGEHGITVNISEILELTDREQYSQACSLYRQEKLKRTLKTDSNCCELNQTSTRCENCSCIKHDDIAVDVNSDTVSSNHCSGNKNNNLKSVSSNSKHDSYGCTCSDSVKCKDGLRTVDVVINKCDAIDLHTHINTCDTRTSLLHGELTIQSPIEYYSLYRKSVFSKH